MLARALSLGGSARTVDLSTNDLALCRRIASGESHLFAQISEQYSGMVAAAIAAQGVDRADIEDLAQQTLINVFKGIAGYRGEAKLSSWIYRIAINVARGHLKKQAARPAVYSVDAAMESGIHPVDEQASKVQGAVIRNRSLAGAMAKLSVIQRTVLTMYYVEELSYGEVADALGMNLNTVRTHIRRGKIQLAELLEEGDMG